MVPTFMMRLGELAGPDGCIRHWMLCFIGDPITVLIPTIINLITKTYNKIVTMIVTRKYQNEIDSGTQSLDSKSFILSSAESESD